MYYVYVLFNRKNNKIYIGQTRNLEERLEFHKNREFKNSYTSRFDGEWVLIYKEEAQDRNQALVREKALKSFRGRESIRSLIK